MRNARNRIGVWVFFSLVFLLIGTGVEAAAPNPIQKKVLSLDECVDYALRNSPDLRQYVESVRAYEGKVIQASSGKKPTLSGSTVYDRILNDGGDSSFETNVSLEQLVSDAGYTDSLIDAARFRKEASQWNLALEAQTLVLNVKQAYFDCLTAKKNFEVAKQALKQYQEHLDEAIWLFNVGMKPKLDVLTAETNLSKAKLSYTDAENTLALSMVSLKKAIGYKGAEEFEIGDIAISNPHIPLVLPQALQLAMQYRPDLKAAQVTEKAYESDIRSAAKNNAAIISVKTGYDWVNGSAVEGDDEWTTGASLSVPIYDGDLTRGKVIEAKANLEVSKAQTDSLKQEITLEVSQALLGVQKAVENIKTTEVAEEQAKESFNLATEGYKVGIGTHLDVTDALQTYVQAQIDHINALYSYESYLAQLDKAVGKNVSIGKSTSLSKD